MDFSAKRLFRRAFLGAFILLIPGVLLLINGICYEIAYHSRPEERTKVFTSNPVFCHVKMEEYSVNDVIYDDNSDLCIFVIDYYNRYLLLKSYKGSESYNELISIIGQETSSHDYIIDGNFCRNKASLAKYIDMNLTQRGYSLASVVNRDYSIRVFNENYDNDLLWGLIFIGNGCLCWLVFFIWKRIKYPQISFWEMFKVSSFWWY